MNHFDEETSRARKVRELDSAELEALLGALAPDRDAAGVKYEELRRRLINMFAWERCEAPDDLADEVLNRLARRVMDGAVIPHVDRFALGIARLVLQEEWRKRRKHEAVLRELPVRGKPSGAHLDDLDAIETCLAALPADRRELIERYYAEDREAMARAMGISLNALRNRALRIRTELFDCVVRKRDES